MDDLISRQAVVDEVHGAIYEFFDICDDDEESPMTYKDEKLLELNKAITIRIKQLPPAEKTGKWEHFDHREPQYDHLGNETWAEAYKCSNCGFIHSVIEDFGHYAYCPNCGARMEE